jgi:hypothetical protein
MHYWPDLGGGWELSVLIPVFLLVNVFILRHGGSDQQPIPCRAEFVAWRLAFFIPASAQLLIGLAILALGRDLPDGNYSDLVKAGRRNRANSPMEMRAVSLKGVPRGFEAPNPDFF